MLDLMRINATLVRSFCFDNYTKLFPRIHLLPIFSHCIFAENKFCQGFGEMSQKTRVCVIGAGVVGLSSAVRIQDELPHCDVTLLADRFSPDTTSDGSGGFWLLHLVGGVSQDLLR